MIPHHHFNQLIDVLEMYFLLPSSFKITLRRLTKYKLVKQGEYLFRIGDIPDIIYFNCGGFFQENTYNRINEQIEPTWFWFKNYFIFTTPGFFSQKPSGSDVIALTEGIVICMSIENFKILTEKHKQSVALSDQIRDKDLRSRMNHGYMTSHYCAEDMLRYFYKKRRALFNIAKKKDIAKFLAIDYDTMRRMLNKIS